MEATIARQTNELMHLKDKMASHDTAAKRAVQTLQNELKKRVDEVSSSWIYIRSIILPCQAFS